MTLTDLMANPYCWLLLAICTVSGLGFGIYQILTNRQNKEISFVKHKFYAIEKGKKSIDGLDILYKGQKTESLIVSRYAIWNSGNILINNNDDVVESRKLCLKCLDDSKILDAKIIAVSEDSNLCKIDRIDDNQVNLTFDYLDKNDGLIIQVLHTGKQDSLVFDCKLKGGNFKDADYSKLDKFLSKRESKSEKLSKSIFVIGLFIVAIGIILSIFSSLDKIYHIIPKDIIFSVNYPINNNIILVLNGIMLIELFFIIKLLFIKIYHLNIPTKLRKFENL